MSMPGSDDLAGLLTQAPVAVVRGGQGVLRSWDPETFDNTVEWRGTSLSNVSVAAGVDALSMSAGDSVILLGFSSTDGGAGSWWILGRGSVPPLIDPVTIKGGDLIVEAGGSFVARDGSAIRALYDDGFTAVMWGTINNVDIGDTGGSLGHGILAQANNGADLLQAREAPDGFRIVVNGGSEANRLDQFWVLSDFISIGSGMTPAEQIFILGAEIRLGTASQETFINHATVGSDDNCVISSAGLIRRVASSRRYKTDIRGLHINPRTVLDLKPRTWRDKSDVAENPDTDRWHVGLIAEEVEDAGLGNFVNYDEQGRPDSIQYDRLAVPLLELCREQQAQLDALTAWATTQGFQPPKPPSVEATVLPKRMPTGTTAPAWPDPSRSDRPARRSDPRS